MAEHLSMICINSIHKKFHFQEAKLLTSEGQKLWTEALQEQTPQSPGLQVFQHFTPNLHQGAANRSYYAARFVDLLQDIVATCASELRAIITSEGRLSRIWKNPIKPWVKVNLP